MNKITDATFNRHDHDFVLSGHLNFSNVMSVYEDSLLLLEKYSSKWNINCAQLQASDSATLALIFEWLKLARQKNLAISFSHLPENIMVLAKAAEIDQLIPIK